MQSYRIPPEFLECFDTFEEAVLVALKHGKTPAQISIYHVVVNENHIIPENTNVMVDGSWQAYDEFIEDVVEHGDDGEQVKVVSLENLLCSYNVMINEEELSL